MSQAIHVEVDSPLEGLRITRELRSGHWELDGWGRRVIVREWTWAERRRLLEACTRDEGLGAGLAREHFIAGLVSLTCEPVPPAQLWPLYAHIVLSVLGIRGVDGEGLAPIAAAERRLAERFGWAPDRIGAQTAGDLDRLLGELSPQQAPAPAPVARAAPPGWQRIVVEDDAP